MWCRVVMLFWFLGAVVIALSDLPARAIETHKLTGFVREFQGRLGIPEQILVFIVKANERLASVRPSHKQNNAFILEVDESFLETLTEDEQRAMIAHELGHVWIFTHPLYLQSEPLANRKAEQLVSQESLAKVYEKVWRLDARAEPLEEFLGKKLGIAQPETSVSSAIPALSTAKPPQPQGQSLTRQLVFPASEHDQHSPSGQRHTPKNRR